MINRFFESIQSDSTSALQYQQLWRFTCNILIGVIMVNAGWDKDKVAIYELLFFTANLLSFAWSTGLKNALLSYFPSLAQNDKRKTAFQSVFDLDGNLDNCRCVI